MILTGKEIIKRLGTDIIIEPFNKKNINPNSYNVTLSNKLLVYDDVIIDTKEETHKVREITIPKKGFIIEPGKLYIGMTNEYTETYNLVPRIEGRSSMGRIGLSTHTSAGFGDVGFKGKWSLHIISLSHKIKIYPNMKIAQLYYNSLLGEIENYKGHYNKQKKGVFNNDSIIN